MRPFQASKSTGSAGSYGSSGRVVCAQQRGPVEGPSSVPGPTQNLQLSESLGLWAGATSEEHGVSKTQSTHNALCFFLGGRGPGVTTDLSL